MRSGSVRIRKTVENTYFFRTFKFDSGSHF